MNPKADYLNFDAQTYLERYYGTIDSENEALIRFIARSMSTLNRSNGSFCDAGCGGSLCASLIAANYVGSIVLADYSRCSREAITLWMNRDPRAFGWDTFDSYIQELIRSSEVPSAILRRKFAAVLDLDVTKSSPLSETGDKFLFDYLYSGFCLEHACDSAVGFSECLGNVSTLLRFGGELILITLMNGRAIFIDHQAYAVATLSAMDVREALAQHGFEIESEEFVQATQSRAEKEYGGMLMTRARKSIRISN